MTKARKTPRTKPQVPSRKEAENAVKTLILWAGDKPEREGLKETPKRFVKAFEEYFAGYRQKPENILNRTFKEVGGYDNTVLVRDIPFDSHCEHHIAPFYGFVHIAYIPNGKVIGLSKLARLVDIYAKRLQTQERITEQVTDALNNVLKPKGVAVMVEAVHTCMSKRGVKKKGAQTVTMQFTGIYKEKVSLQKNFLVSCNRK